MVGVYVVTSAHTQDRRRMGLGVEIRLYSSLGGHVLSDLRIEAPFLSWHV